MAKVNATEWLDKWGTNMNAAGPYITKGVKAVTTAPGIKAAAASGKWIAAIQQSQKKWEAQVARVDLPTWQDAMINKGLARISAGVTTAQKTKQARIEALLNAVDASTNEVNSMPTDTIEQRVQKSMAYQMAMHRNAPRNKG